MPLGTIDNASKIEMKFLEDKKFDPEEVYKKPNPTKYKF